ncbi:HDOD domain-containing protein [Gemmata sp. JC717]|uniref:protein kinase domain-containing protein n=1 Tax=Gemmata algarum TaxID=2975278 RepID=UPI0021BA68C9|nr:HDOD domain-containing protein [Gemmata algarum]MDY3557354.1 HDOD domain-containing protein [Gemmata algarum]
MSAPPLAPDTPTAMPHNRKTVLAAVMDPRRLPTPPALALQVVNAASRPNCDPDEIVSLLGQDPALCARLLKVVNSCLYGRSKPITSLDRAVTVLGLGTVRSLVLSLSMPAAKGAQSDPLTRANQINSVAGALIAYELSALQPRSSPADDMVAGLLRDLGAVLLQQTYPDDWADLTERWGDRLLSEACEAETEVFGISHAEISAELLAGWKLPPEVVEPIRHHHNPDQLASGPVILRRRAELLYFSGLLANLDTVIRYPDLLDYVLLVARTRYDLPQPALIRFMRGVVPKITEFGELLNRDVRDCPDFAEVLSAGAQEMAHLLGVNRSNTAPGSKFRRAPTPAPPQRPAPATRVDVWAAARHTPFVGHEAPTRVNVSSTLPQFQPNFLSELPARGCRLGEYELRSVLGRGAMGVVFKAFEPSLARWVAVKMMAPETSANPIARERFAREARACAAIRHDNVVTVYSVREAAGVPYLAMEFVEGEPLDRYIEQRHPIPVPQIVNLGAQIASGLAAAHRKGIVHRDIKPANVILETETGTAKLADFGLARSGDDAQMSHPGAMVGTPHFMSPEQVHGHRVTATSDLFSLGGVLYALCTGQPPVRGKALMAILYAVCFTAPVPPRQLRPDIPEWLEEVVLRLLDKNADRRFQSAAELAALLNSKKG